MGARKMKGITREEATELSRDTRVMIKEIADRAEKRDDKFMEVMQGIGETQKLIADATKTLNHNSTATLEAINSFKESLNSIAASQSRVENQWMTILRMVAYASIPIAGAVLGVKSIMP